MKKYVLVVVLLTLSALPALASHDGALIGAPAFGPAAFGNGMLGLTDSDYATVPAVVCPSNSLGNWTVEAQVSNSSQALQTAVECRYGTGTDDIWIGMNAAGQFDAAVFSSDIPSGVAINDGAMHQVKLECSGGSVVNSYVDGVLANSVAKDCTFAQPATAGFIGRYAANGFAWSGTVDEVAFWSAAEDNGWFTPATAQYTGAEANLTGLYHLESSVADSTATQEVAACGIPCVTSSVPGGASAPPFGIGSSGSSNAGSSGTSNSGAASTAGGCAGPGVVQCTTAKAAVTGTPVSFSLGAVPTAGNLLVANIVYNVYGDYDVTPPDATWTCALGGRGTASSIRINTCTHIVVAGDPVGYAFFSNTTAGNGIAPSGLLMEMSGVTSAQISYLALTTPQSTITTPSLTPAAPGSVAFATIAGTDPLTTAPSGWVQVTAATTAILQQATTGISPVSVTLNVSNKYGNSVVELALFAPGRFAAAALATPAAGSYGNAQTVLLSCSTLGCLTHYTLDGTAPSCASPVYTAPLSVAATMTIASVVCAPGFANSAVANSQYVIGPGMLSGVALGPLADLHGWQPWANDLWHQRIDQAPLDANSDTIMGFLEGLKNPPNLRPDFSIPYVVVDSTVNAPSAWSLSNGADVQSDNTYYPFPAAGTLPIEGNPPANTVTGDNHALIVDRSGGALYELWRTVYNPGGTPAYAANNGAVFDLQQPTSVQRPYGYTSADAGGLSVFEGLLRYDEAAAGPVTHAVRFTSTVFGAHFVNGSGYGYFELPALHSAPTGSQALNAPNLIDYGMRLRLKASFDISSYSPIVQNILTGMKNYGLLLADQGGMFDFQGTPDARWNVNDVTALGGIPASAFEVVQKGVIYDGGNNYPHGPAPVIAQFTASPSSITAGQCAVLTPTVSGQTSLYIDLVGFVRGPVTVCPTATTVYTLTANGLNLAHDDGYDDGSRPTATATVTVVKP